MASFKTKKISKKKPNNFWNFHTKKSLPDTSRVPEYDDDIYTLETDSTSSQKKQKTPSKARKLTGILLILGSIVFLIALGVQWVSSMKVWGNILESNIFKAISIDSTAQKKWTENILIAGIGGKGHPWWELTDSLMLANLDHDKKTVTLLSIPRDIFVAYDKKSGGKINSLYPIGQSKGEGINLLASKVSEMTGQPIQHYIVIDFSWFKAIVDALWGVTVDVPENIYDKEYPDENWWYEVFSLKKWIQTLDGDTALKFARSRHSTSDFDRSSRQQLLLKAIKQKALSLGILTDPKKISNIINSVQDNLSTDLTVWQLVNIGMDFKDMDNGNIDMYSFNDDCDTWACKPWAYLYQPSMSLFGNAWVLLPNGASRSRLSVYDDMKRFATLIFEYPSLNKESENISIVTSQKNISKAQSLRKDLEKLWFPINHSHTIYQTGSIEENSKIIVNTTTSSWASLWENSVTIKALKHIEPNIPIEYKTSNEYISGSGARIEIILGSDKEIYFNFGSNTTPDKEEAKSNTYKTTKNSSKNTNTIEDTETSQQTISSSSKNNTSQNHTISSNSDTSELTLPSDSLFPNN